MKPFQYSEPSSLDEAVVLMRDGPEPVSLLAGGTDLLVLMKEDVVKPRHVINIKKIAGMDDFSFDPKHGLLLGALVTTRQVETSDITRRHYASLAKAATDFASIQVRNRATIAGNLCRASPSADTLPPLIADGAVVRIRGSGGERRVPLQEFCVGPGRTVLASDEIVTHIEIPAPMPRTGKSYIKLGRRQQMELATVGVAAHVTLDESGLVADAAIVLASVAPTPLRAVKAESRLRGNAPSSEIVDAAARAASEEARPIDDVRASASYRTEMVHVLTRRAVEQAIKEAQA